MQVVLLRFLESGEIQRIGADRSHTRVNVRLITATNRDLEAQIIAGAFREDLFFRLNVVRLSIPPLRERVEDIPLLVNYYLNFYSQLHKVPTAELARGRDGRPHRLSLAGQHPRAQERRRARRPQASGQTVEHADLPGDIVRSGAIRPSFGADGRGSSIGATSRAEELAALMLKQGESFWAAVYPIFMSRDLTRADLRKIIQIGLEITNGNYRLLVQLFNMPTAGLQAVPELPAQARLPPAVPAFPRRAGSVAGSRPRQSRCRRPQRLGR